MALIGKNVELRREVVERTDDCDKSKTKSDMRQVLTALGPIMGSIAAGMTSGYSAILLPQLQVTAQTGYNSSGFNVTGSENFDEIVVRTTEEESWVAASAALLMAPGCWISGILMEKFGRKISHLIVSPIFLLGWLTVGFAPNMLWLICGRLICGLCVGLHGPLGSVYVAETSHPRLRGILLSGISLAIAIGILISHILGTWLHWRLTAYLCALFPVLCFAFCTFAPESPTWLIGKHKPQHALKAWYCLRGKYSMHEFESLKSKNVSEQSRFKKPEDGEENEVHDDSNDKSKDNAGSPVYRKPLWRSQVFVKPLLILTVFFVTTQFSGVNSVAFYCVQMLKEVSGPENAYSATIILDVIRVIFSVIACWLTRKYPRRVLAMVSGVGSSLTLLGLSICLYLDFGKPWLSIVWLFSYTCLVSLGLVPLPWLLCGELFSASMRGLGSGLSSGFAFICFFIVVKTGPAMFENLGTPGTFCVYGSMALAGTIFLYFFLPETKDKTLQEIEDKFASKTTKKTSLTS